MGKSEDNLHIERLSDRELVRLICEGQRELLEELYRRYSGKVYYKCLQLLKDGTIAQDLAHDVMIKVFTNLGKFEGRSDFSFWIHAITYNYCMSHLRKKNKLSFAQSVEEGMDIVDHNEEKLKEKILYDLQLDELERLLDQATPEDKMLLTMYYQDDLSIKQMSQILKIGESAVKMRLMRSRKRLAEKFKSTVDE